MIFDVFIIQKPRPIQIGVSMTYTAEHVSAACSPKEWSPLSDNSAH